MKLYANKVPQNLPHWATVISKNADLIELEINDEDPSFQSLLEKIATEIEPGIIGVKAIDLCSTLSIAIWDID
ncbi:MAG: hypothetical protein KME32_16565 [Mojavia pulchra JT2-VF2]|jgi:hypothetical protein|uniref:Uncharacterized protein n=1 Tax=Mojavia pulchra JT2-VF2 TaxID=287848 RepID=A0A951Q1Q9_9NOST|nr:hypothetical protein [Mojavia pulchra JT2-VF2]